MIWQGPEGPKLNQDYVSEMSKCITGIYLLLHP